MAIKPRRLIAGNWKMNGTRASVSELAGILAGSSGLATGLDLLVCPPATLTMTFADQARGSAVLIGAQDCHPEASGAFTGEISAEMLKDAGAVAVIVGHSERRILYYESSAAVRAKADAAKRAGLLRIICVGETRAERDAGNASKVVRRQLDESLPGAGTASDLVVAYEPVWAIGSGLTPTLADVAELHRIIRDAMRAKFGQQGKEMRILYGGSVKPANAVELLQVENVDGALVGGASLKAADFLAIARAAC
jgi:triosephosphate isomerase